MKKKFIIFFLLASLSNIYTAYHYSKLVTYIGKSNFMSIGATTLDNTFTIETAGTYVLTENIASALTSNQIISISTDNVTLDLNGYTITGQSNFNMNGIEVISGKKNIVIKNGTIYSIGNSGIKVNSSVQNLKISNILFNTCNGNNASQAGGIALVGGSGTEIDHCTIDNCITFSIVPQTNDAYGIYAKNTRYLTIKNCKAESVRNIGKNRDAIAYYIENSEYPSIINSNAYLTEGGDIGAGIYLLTCTGAQVSNCTVEGSLAVDIAKDGTPGKGYGFYFNDTNNALINECTSTNNGGGIAGNGFYIISCRNNRFLNCIAKGNHGTNASGLEYCTGFETARDTTTPKGITQGCIFKNCSAIGQYTGLTTKGAAGFLLGDQTKFCMIEHCLAMGNNGQGGTVYGIFLNGDNLKLNIIKNNCVFSNIANTKTDAYGIYENTSAATKTLFFENEVSNNGNQAGEANDTTPDISSSSYTIPTYGTNLDTFNSTQANIKGWNFIAKADYTP